MTLPSLYDEGPFAPVPRPFNLAAHALAAADRTPGKTALEILAAPGEVAEAWSYARLRDAVLRAAGGLAARGVAPGDRVLLRIGNSSDFPVLFLAANALGAIPVPTSTLLTAPEVATLVDDLDPRAILVGAGVAPPPDPGRADLLLAPDLARLRAAAPVAGFAATDPDDPAYILYTSGSASRPKGVLHAQRAAWARRMMWDGWYGLTAEDRVLHAGAFNWAYTLGAGLMDPWAAGATALIHAGPPSRHVWPALAAAHRATLFAAVPGVYRQMLDAPALRAGFARLRHGLSAGEALPASVAAAWTAATGKPVYEAIGMTEISTYVSFSPTSPPLPGHVGRPQQGRRVAILPEDDETPGTGGSLGSPGTGDTPTSPRTRRASISPGAGRTPASPGDDTPVWPGTGGTPASPGTGGASASPGTGETPVPRGAEGLLAVSRRDPGLMLGYWRRPEETAAAMRGEWFLTGDRARMDPSGTIAHLGRAGELMNAGGYRVSPAEVEAALALHPGVAEAAVAEIALRDGVSIIAAFYVPAGAPVPPEALAAHCAARLARYKLPRAFHAVAALPRTANGKLRRAALAGLLP
ncbi:class I adenylate-forming enzyme family protein [Amaricoccus sp.]|uniref:class I adenylate-forming enzyme family protein n=1 Tax=Amaricoccus sp. TaxID=1872485 RepID=UPI001B6C3CD2|nr:AMP-binding protein [Amaricoccus sp.]MBP7000542.1 AMP-binding protein [Amaricoccus sp.]